MTIETTASPATDLGYVLAKHPDHVATFDLSVGKASVFYPIANAQRCQIALFVDVDVARLAKSTHFRHDDFALSAYVNDRQYTASSLLTVAIGRVFNSALAGSCQTRPDLAERTWPLTIHVPAVGGTPALARQLFEPLGWRVTTGDAAPPVDLTITGQSTVQRALQHLYVLLPVLDDSKHYWVDQTETDKLLRHGADWLPNHPAQALITGRYLAHQRPYIADATARLLADDSAPTNSCQTLTTPSLATTRYETIVAQLKALGASTVVDMGCGEGHLITALLADPQFTRVIGADVSPTALSHAEAALARLPERQQQRATLLQSSVVYRDARLAGFDAIVLAEVIEHVDADRLPALAQSIFGAAKPQHVIITTPNVEYNATFATLTANNTRHIDHRFEWTRAQFAQWVDAVCAQFGYTAKFDGIGPVDPQLGAPTQMAVFSRSTGGAE